MLEWIIFFPKTLHCPEYLYGYLYFIKSNSRNYLLTLFCRFFNLKFANKKTLQNKLTKHKEAGFKNIYIYFKNDL